MLEQAQPARLDDYLAIKPGFGLPEMRKRIERCATTGGTWYVWRENEQYVGWCVVAWSGKPTQPEFPDISDLRVREECRGSGTGTAIMGAVEHAAARRGYDTIGIAVNPEHNPRALALYKRLGYVEIGTQSYVDGVYDGFEDWVIDMKKQIQPDAAVESPPAGGLR